MDWVNQVWKWCDHLIGHSGTMTQAGMLIVLVLGVVLLGSWAMSRIAQ